MCTLVNVLENCLQIYIYLLDENSSEEMVPISVKYNGLDIHIDICVHIPIIITLVIWGTKEHWLTGVWPWACEKKQEKKLMWSMVVLARVYLVVKEMLVQL